MPIQGSRRGVIPFRLYRGSDRRVVRRLRNALHINTKAPRRLLLFWVLMLTFVAAGELLPGDSTPMRVVSGFDLSDSVLHLSAYAAVVVVPAIGLRVGILAICIVITELVGVALELGQVFVPGRSFDPRDIVSNSIGVLAGITVALIFRLRLFRRDECL